MLHAIISYMFLFDGIDGRETEKRLIKIIAHKLNIINLIPSKVIRNTHPSFVVFHAYSTVIISKRKKKLLNGKLIYMETVSAIYRNKINLNKLVISYWLIKYDSCNE